MAEKKISFYKGQTAVRGQGQTTCEHHKGVSLDWFCEGCHDVICAKCVSTSHKGHDLILLSEVTSGNKRKIKTFINETDLIEIQQELNSTEDILNEHLNHFESVAKEVKKQGEKLKEDIDVLIAQTLSQLKHLEDENTQVLVSYKTDLEQKLAVLKEQLKQCKETLQTGTDIQVFDLTKGLQTNITLPEKPNLGSADFIPNNNWKTTLEEAFGKVTFIPSGQSQGQTSTGSGQSDETSVQDTMLSSRLQQQEEMSTDTSYDQEKVIFPQMMILSELNSPYEVNCMRLKSGVGVWTSFYNIINHMNSQGEKQQEIQSPVNIKDISLSPTTHNLWVCSSSDKSVLELISGELANRFKTKDEPRCLCVTGDEHILVGTKHRITKYTPEGKPGITTKTYFFWKPMVCSPKTMSLCPLSDNIAVVDEDRTEDGGKEHIDVIVLDKQLKELYRFGKSQYNSVHKANSFRPWDVTYDSQGCLVISDLANYCLHLLSGDGQYLRMLDTDKDVPLAVCVDTEGVLWTVFGLSDTNHKMKRLQYTSV